MDLKWIHILLLSLYYTFLLNSKEVHISENNFKMSKLGMIMPLVQSIKYFPILSQAQGNIALCIILLELL